MTIFVQIASYRDPQLIPTIKNLLETAKHPENLRFGICRQYSDEDGFDNIDEYRNDSRFRILDVPYNESKGACWARHLIQQLYKKEEYTFQIDSHMRFVQDWDVKLIGEIDKLMLKGHYKPLITGYLPSFDPENEENSKVQIPWKMNYDRFSPDGNVHFLPASIDNFKELDSPINARFYSAHFAFTIGRFADEVQHNPDYYFHGEEISIAVRAFTHGYDLFHLHYVIGWHFYTRKGLKKHWDDHTDWVEINNTSHKNNRTLFGMESEGTLDPRFGFGTIRTLQDYEKYAGISFEKRAVQRYTLDFKEPPNPVYETEEEYDKSFTKVFKHCIDVGYHQVPHDDYDVWVVAFEDENGVELKRADANESEIRRMKNDPDGYCKIWRSFETDIEPYKWVVWPHSKEHGWCDRIEGVLYEKKINTSENTEIDRTSNETATELTINETVSQVSENKSINEMKILIHLPAYREPELLKTIESALENAEFPDRLVFGICRQYNPDDGFDNLDKYRWNNEQFKIKDIHYTQAKGLPYARAVINDELLTDEDFVLQLDAHHRFDTNFDTTLLTWYFDLKEEGYNPLICGYLPYYDPFNDPEKRVKEPWFSEAASFYPHGTIFIRPTGMRDWKKQTKPVRARFISGHFAFGPNQWARDVRHDPNIYFSGEELNLTVRSFTHGYDLFHPHKVVIWHATMREERSGKLVWDDEFKRGDTSFHNKQSTARSRIRQLLGVEDNGHDLGVYGLGNKRTVRDYEKYAGINFKTKSFQKYTIDNHFPPNPQYATEEEFENSFTYSFYHLVNIDRNQLPGKYDSILVAFDDEEGKSVFSKSIDGLQLQKFLNGEGPIHYEEMFLTDKNPSKVVYWGHSMDEGWKERVEFEI